MTRRCSTRPGGPAGYRRFQPAQPTLAELFREVVEQ